MMNKGNEQVRAAFRHLTRAGSALRGRPGLSQEAKVKYLDYAKADLTEAITSLSDAQTGEKAMLVAYAKIAIQRALVLVGQATAQTIVEEQTTDSDEQD